jgi:hypothetical protein
MGKTELSNSAKPLENRTIEDRDFPSLKPDSLPNGIVDYFVAGRALSISNATGVLAKRLRKENLKISCYAPECLR